MEPMTKNDVLAMSTENVELTTAYDETDQIGANIKRIPLDAADTRAILCAQSWNQPTEMLEALVMVHGIRRVKQELEKLEDALDDEPVDMAESTT